ncbi:MAG: DUF1254 domain-containing protein [Alistipes senegalensis]|nr:DUF1254 domain-containing protein [Oxalobacter formigenes]MCM1280830.1 DUF1254 domain-containing protein [Alistipes senegalensis]
MKLLKFLAGLAAALLLVSCNQKPEIPDAEITALAKEAYIYGYPMVRIYGEMYASAIDAQGPDYKKPFNEFYFSAQPDMPGSGQPETASHDTPYGSAWLDLRREPLVLTVPAVEDGRYYSVQFTDLFSYNFDYAGSRTAGNQGGRFLIAGPGWKGETPEGINRVIQSDTSLAHALVRVQLMNAEDLPNVEKIQGEFTLEPLSQYTGAEAPPEVAPVDFPVYRDEDMRTPAFFSCLNFLMQFVSVPQDEAALMARLGKISIGAGKPFSTEEMAENEKKAYQAGIDGAIADMDAARKGDLIKGADMHGTRAELKNHYLNRAYGAMTDLYGASPQEIFSIAYKLDSEFKPLNGTNRYLLRFEKDKLPPTDAFWSLTLYELPGQLLADNPLKRYHITSNMVSQMETDTADDSVTVFIRKVPPAAGEPVVEAAQANAGQPAGEARAASSDARAAQPAAANAAQPQAGSQPSLTAAQPEEKPVPEANLLPAPDGDFYMVMRIYVPKEDALNGTWKEPVVMRPEAAEAAKAAAEAAASVPDAQPAPDSANPAAQPVAGTPAGAGPGVPVGETAAPAPVAPSPAATAAPAAQPASPAVSQAQAPAPAQVPAVPAQAAQPAAPALPSAAQPAAAGDSAPASPRPGR